MVARGRGSRPIAVGISLVLAACVGSSDGCVDCDGGLDGDAILPLALAAPSLVWDIPSANHQVPFGNGTGVRVADDGRVLFTYTENQRIHVGTAAISSAAPPDTVELNGFSGVSALAFDSPFAVLVTKNLATREMEARLSFDAGQSWDAQPERLGDGGVGPSVPAACAWQDGTGTRAMAAWVVPENSEDGGPLYVAVWDGGWSAAERVGTGTEYSAPTLACAADGQELVVRDQWTAVDIRIQRFVRQADGSWGEATTVIAAGADPHYCRVGGDAWIGYHLAGSAFVARSLDDGPWTASELDSTGKFVPIACRGEREVVACNGDWDTKADAESRAPGRRVLCHYSRDGGQSWESFSPAPGESGQTVTSVGLSDAGLAILWQSDAAVRLALYGRGA
jgi:hypothetical protein